MKCRHMVCHQCTDVELQEAKERIAKLERALEAAKPLASLLSMHVPNSTLLVVFDKALEDT